MRKMRPKVRLSLLQQQFLRRLDAQVRSIMRQGTGEDQSALVAWGIPWKPRGRLLQWTPAQRSACSRALHRLEQRGLVLRRNRRGSTVKQTTHVQLSDRGVFMVQWLIAEGQRDVNRAFHRLELRIRALRPRRRRKTAFHEEQSKAAL